MIFENVKDFIKQNKLPLYRISQIRQAVYENGISCWEEATNLPASLRQDLSENIKILSFE